MGSKPKKSAILVGELIFSKLSPLQRKIVLELSARPLTLSELSRRTGSSVYTVGKQLSLLQFRPKYNPLHGKGISGPLIRKRKEAGFKTTYFINVPKL